MTLDQTVNQSGIYNNKDTIKVKSDVVSRPNFQLALSPCLQSTIHIMSTITNGITVHVPRHRLRNGLEAGKPMIGCFSSLPSAWTARIVASCGWDVSWAPSLMLT